MNGIASPSAGPNVIGFRAGIARGAFTDIVDIVAPSAAAYGELVSVDVRVRNIGDYAFYIAVTGRYDGTDIYFLPDYAYVEAGSTTTLHQTFTMPDKAITLDVWSFYWTGEEWIQDDSESVSISVVVPVAGTISRKQLEYDEARANIPAVGIQQNQRGLVHIWGRNDTSVAQQLGIYWFVADPDGYVVEEYSAWESWPYTGAGKEHEFIGGRFTFSKPGKYTMWVELIMNPDNPQIVDRYIGDLCTVVAAVPEPEFRDFGVVEYIKL